MFGSKKAEELESLQKSYKTACSSINKLNELVAQQKQRIVQLESVNRKLTADLEAATRRAEAAEKEAATPRVQTYNSAYHYDDVELCVIQGEEPDYLSLPIGTKLFFEREPKNKYDKKAVRVSAEGGRKIGYLFKGKLQKMAYDFCTKDRCILGQVTSNNGRKVLFCMDFFHLTDDAALECDDYDEDDL